MLAAWALTCAIETGRGHLLLLAASLVAIGFNVKMLVASGPARLHLTPTLPLPNFRFVQRIGHLAAAVVV